MDISEIRQIIQDILLKKGLNIKIDDDTVLYPDYFSSLEMAGALLTIDKKINQYKLAKLGLFNLTIMSIYSECTQ